MVFESLVFRATPWLESVVLSSSSSSTSFRLPSPPSLDISESILGLEGRCCSPVLCNGLPLPVKTGAPLEVNVGEAESESSCPTEYDCDRYVFGVGWRGIAKGMVGFEDRSFCEVLASGKKEVDEGALWVVPGSLK